MSDQNLSPEEREAMLKKIADLKKIQADLQSFQRKWKELLERIEDIQDVEASLGDL